MTIYDKILAVYAKIRAAINNKPGRDDIAYEFSSGAGYSYGDLVYYENSLYMCVEDHHSGEWDADHFIRADVNDAINERASLQDLEGRARKIDIAANFSVAVRYEVGDLVYYNGVLYRCIAVHDWAAWDSSHFTRADVNDVMRTKLSQSDLSSMASKNDIAETFSTSKNYVVGNLVTYNNLVYCCISAHSAGAWNSSHFARTTVGEALDTKISQDDFSNTAALKTDIARVFSASNIYSVGDLVFYQGFLYCCTTPHIQESWNASHFTRGTVEEALGYKAPLSYVMEKPGYDAIAADFSATASYEVGRLVIRELTIYRCTVAHTGAWDSNHFVLANVDDVLKTKAAASDLASKADKSVIAPQFSTSVAYSSGDLVYKDGVLYRCVSEHAAGAWDNAHFTEASVNDVLTYSGGTAYVDTANSGVNSINISSETMPVVDASQITSLLVTPEIPPETVSGKFKVTDMLLRVDTGANGCVISHGWSGPCICSNPNWNILPANSINILTYTYAGQVSSTDPDPVFLVGVVSSQIDTSSSS